MDFFLFLEFIINSDQNKTKLHIFASAQQQDKPNLCPPQKAVFVHLYYMLRLALDADGFPESLGWLNLSLRFICSALTLTLSG